MVIPFCKVFDHVIFLRNARRFLAAVTASAKWCKRDHTSKSARSSSRVVGGTYYRRRELLGDHYFAEQNNVWYCVVRPQPHLRYLPLISDRAPQHQQSVFWIRPPEIPRRASLDVSELLGNSVARITALCWRSRFSQNDLNTE